MADLNTTIQHPAWWRGDTPLDTAVDDALASQAQRERWKYTKPAKVLSLLPADHKTTLASCVRSLPEVVQSSIISHDQAVDNLQAADFGDVLHDAPEALSVLCRSAALQLLTIPANESVALQLSHEAPGMPVLIKVAEHASVQIEETVSANLDNRHQHCIWLQLGAGSSVTHARNLLGWSADAATPPELFRHLQVDVGADARYTLQNHCVGAGLHRQNVHIFCRGPGAHAELTSAAYVPRGAHLDQQITVQHAGVHSTSQQTVHNIAADKANVTFNGRIHIHSGAQGVQAHLSNKNLGMGDQATINTKPELEIYTDDVQCSHGATVGQLDDNHLFYFASRGLAPVDARKLLSNAFLKTCTTGVLAEPALVQFAAHMAQDTP